MSHREKLEQMVLQVHMEQLDLLGQRESVESQDQEGLMDKGYSLLTSVYV